VIEPDIETLNKKLIFARSMDTPDTVYAVVPEANPVSTFPKDQVRLETYVRLKSLPSDMMKLVLCITEARSIANKISQAVPFLPKASPKHYPSGVVEMQWPLDKGGIFGIVLHGFTSYLDEEDEELRVKKSGRITWRFHGPQTRHQHGEFKSVDELMEFFKTSFIDTKAS
jgi:hypothetical protein